MHKYQPRIHIVRRNKGPAPGSNRMNLNEEVHRTFVFTGNTIHGRHSISESVDNKAENRKEPVCERIPGSQWEVAGVRTRFTTRSTSDHAHVQSGHLPTSSTGSILPQSGGRQGNAVVESVDAVTCAVLADAVLTELLRSAVERHQSVTGKIGKSANLDIAFLP
ncbi:hypothetical protein OSTOST_12605 [Ostertagia ostertagi]